ncbi:MAG: glucose-1-phosphate adenylyltransferase [Chloroflexi bacterium]|nr:glucose-1-phosphate adenylyltransferase [Chloroflexota bacterium]
MNRVLALILAGGQGDRLSVLSEERAKPAVIFGGKYRIIDFPLSNCANSGIFQVGILTQHRPHSLNDHIGVGRPWDLDRSAGGIFLLQPYTGRRASDWYRGTADAVYQNLEFVAEQRVDQVLILSGDNVYTMHYEPMVNHHRYVGADVSIAVTPVPQEEINRYGIVSVDEEGRVIEFLEKPDQASSNLASMGIYVFNKGVLIERLREDARRRSSTHDFGRDILPRMLQQDRVYAYQFRGYWRDVGTIDAYWQAHMDLLVDLPAFNLYDPENVVRTKSAERPSVKVGPRGQINRSLVSNGCIINGTVNNAILSPGVFVEEGARVQEAIIFDDTVIQRDAVVEHCILDKEVRVGEGSHLGVGDDLVPNRDRSDLLSSGLTIVGKRAWLPAGLRVGRNCIIGPNIRPEDFASLELPSGETLRTDREWLVFD